MAPLLRVWAWLEELFEGTSPELVLLYFLAGAYLSAVLTRGGCW